jgi:hypothetical protein
VHRLAFHAHEFVGAPNNVTWTLPLDMTCRSRSA